MHKQNIIRHTENKLFVVETILECVTVELTIKNHTNVVFSCNCRKPGSPIDTFCETLELNLCDVESIKTIFVCGDFNIDLLKHETHNNTKHFLDTMYSLGLYPLIDKPTRITDNSTTLIDNIFTNELRFNLISGIMYNDISDIMYINDICKVSQVFKYILFADDTNLLCCDRACSDDKW